MNELRLETDGSNLLINGRSTIRSTSNPREVSRPMAANIRQVIHADAVTVALPDSASGKIRVFAMDFSRGKGLIKEDLLVATSTAAKKAMDTLKPVALHRPQSANCMPGNADRLRTNSVT